jgi:hypothetical protein
MANSIITTTSTEIELASSAEDVKNLILTIRDKQVLLDSDVARLYGYEVKAINQAASRNIKRFPSDFRFQLTDEEVDEILKSQVVISSMRSQVVTASKRNIRYRPFAFTQQGIGMLSGILKNDTAVHVSIDIMNAFVEMQRFISTNRDVFANIANINRKLLEHDGKFIKQDKKIDEILNLLSVPETVKQSIFYRGQFYDALKLVIEIIKTAKKQIVVIDNYADDTVIDMLSKKNDGVMRSTPNWYRQSPSSGTAVPMIGTAAKSYCLAAVVETISQPSFPWSDTHAY